MSGQDNEGGYPQEGGRLYIIQAPKHIFFHFRNQILAEGFMPIGVHCMGIKVFVDLFGGFKAPAGWMCARGLCSCLVQLSFIFADVINDSLAPAVNMGPGAISDTVFGRGHVDHVPLSDRVWYGVCGLLIGDNN